jgi:hypothetical protein
MSEQSTKRRRVSGKDAGLEGFNEFAVKHGINGMFLNICKIVWREATRAANIQKQNVPVYDNLKAKGKAVPLEKQNNPSRKMYNGTKGPGSKRATTVEDFKHWVANNESISNRVTYGEDSENFIDRNTIKSAKLKRKRAKSG